MNTERLDQIEARANAATEGPWVAEATSIYGAPYGGGHSYAFPMIADLVKWEANADFIAHARTDVPDLVAALRGTYPTREEIAAAMYARYNEGESLPPGDREFWLADADAILALFPDAGA